MLADILVAAGGRLYVSPQVCFAPCDVVVRVSPPDEGRDLAVGIYGDDWETYTQMPKPSRTIVLPPFKAVPAGDYEVVATTGPKWTARTSLHVTGMDQPHEHSYD